MLAAPGTYAGRLRHEARMLRTLALVLPASHPRCNPRPVERVALAFEIARTAHLENDTARAMHRAAAWLDSGLNGDGAPDIDDGT